MRSTIDIDYYFIARTKNIVLGGGNIHLGLESQRTVVKNITAKDFLASAFIHLAAGLHIALHLADILNSIVLNSTIRTDLGAVELLGIGSGLVGTQAIAYLSNGSIGLTS